MIENILIALAVNVAVFWLGRRSVNTAAVVRRAYIDGTIDGAEAVAEIVNRAGSGMTVSISDGVPASAEVQAEERRRS